MAAYKEVSSEYIEELHVNIHYGEAMNQQDFLNQDSAARSYYSNPIAQHYQGRSIEALSQYQEQVPQYYCATNGYNYVGNQQYFSEASISSVNEVQMNGVNSTSQNSMNLDLILDLDKGKYIGENHSQQVNHLMHGASEVNILPDVLNIPEVDININTNVHDIGKEHGNFNVVQDNPNVQNYLSKTTVQQEVRPMPLSENNQLTERNSSDIKIKCNMCDKQFQRRSYLIQHNKAHHSGDMPFRCAKCGKKYRDIGTYEEHVSRHNDTKPHKCPECPKSFNHKTDLRRHMCSHSTDRPHVCHICNKGFVRNDHLVKHIERHVSGKVLGGHKKMRK